MKKISKKFGTPGVGSLSQSTICRFESLTLSHNNMVALRPILVQWLDRAEEAARNNQAIDGIHCPDRKRKRTSIAAPEKRALEGYVIVYIQKITFHCCWKRNFLKTFSFK